MRTLAVNEWQALEQTHAARVDAATSAHLQRRHRGEKHPVEDFLFEYYGFTPGKLRRWHPGPGVRLEGSAGMPRAGWRFYVTEEDATRLDHAAYAQVRGRTVSFVRELLGRTAARAPQLGCFGLHEWAMVHGLDDDEVRHRGWPLRLGARASAEVLESHPVRCSHFDAYRFFTPSAAPLNQLRPTRESQVELDQPGCLHAGMDVYKWCFKLTPLVPSALTMDAFDLALEIRLLDMQASPYDLAALGVEPVRIETREGKAEYVERQRDIAQRSNVMRARLLDVLDLLDTVARAG